MNFKRLLLFLVAPLAMVMGSCTPTEEPEYTTPQITITDEAGAEVTAINFEAEGGDKTITIKATRSWEITKSATWFNATPASDTNLNLQEKSVEVKFTAMPNDEAARTETIKIVMDKIEKSIVVSQADAEGNVAGPQGEGTLESPYNVGRAMEIILAGSYTEDMVYTKGIISELGEDGRAQYGNYTFSISDDGTTTGQLLAYRCKYLNGKNFTTSDNLAIGDEVIVCGQLINFKGNTPEIQSCYIASHNGFMPEPPALKEGVYASDAAFVCNIDNSNDAVYSLGDTNVGGNDVSGFKLGTGSKAGVFTSAAIGVSGDKYLNFYAVAWNGKSATLYYRVQGGETMSQAVVANTGANNNAPYNSLVIAESDHFSVKLTGLQATDKIEFSTDASFSAAANDKSGRALVFGIKLTDEALGGEAGGNEGGETPEPPVVDGEFIYYDNFDKVAAVQVDKYWPDMSAEYGNPMPATQSAVTYNSNNATARNNSNSNGSFSDYAGSGVNNVFFGKNPTYLTIGGISLAELEGNALTITFGTERYVKDADNTVKNEEFQIYISGDGEKWSPVTYTYSGTPGRWNVATAQLSLKEVPATLSIHFAASVESAYRLDDLKIVAGGEGAEIDLSQGVALDGIGGGEGGETPEPEEPEQPEDPETPVEPEFPTGEEVTATITFDNTAKRTELTTSVQVWQENGITVTNNKSASTTNIADYSNPVRFYKNSEVVIAAPATITKLVIESPADGTNANQKYLTFLQNSLNGTVSVDGTTVTVVPATVSDTYTFSATQGQVRFYSVTVTYIGTGSEGGETPENPGEGGGDEPDQPGEGGGEEPTPDPEQPEDPEIPVEPETLEALDANAYYVFKQATEFAPGKWYAMVAENNAATANTKNYDRLASTAAIALTDGISLPAACAFGFVSAEGGYTIQQYDMDYLQSTADYNTFNFLATAPASGHIWSVELTDGVATIVNTDTNKSLSYSPNYKNFEANATLNTAPALYELVEVDTNSHLVGVGVSSLSFAAEGGEKTFDITTYGDATLNVSDDAEWLTVSVADGVVTVVAAANEGEARTAEVTVTFGEDSKTITIAQGAPVADGAEVTDIINNAFTGVGAVTNYTEWSGKTGVSGAVYAGQSAGDSGTVQMRSSKSNSGIVTTTSGGKVTKIVITWNTTKTTNTSRTVDIYGSHTAFSQATDMYNSKKADATKIASAKLADATDGVSEITLDGTYEFVGFRSNDGALYLDSIEVTWTK